MENAPLRRADIPFLLSGTVARVIMIGAPASILYGVFTDAAFREGRPGIADGIVGAALGMLLVRLLAGWLAVGWERQSIGMREDILWAVRPHFDPAFATTFFGSVALSVAVGWLLSHIFGLGWPWCGQQPSVLPGILGWCVAFFYSVASWYDKLPE